MGKVVLLLLLITGLKVHSQLDSFPRINELSGHIYIQDKDSLIHLYAGESTLSPLSYHSDSSYVNLVAYSELIIKNICDSLTKANKLSTERTIQSYIYSFKNTNLKVSDVLNHTSGITLDIWQLYKEEVLRGENVFCSKSLLDNECLIDLVLKHDSLKEFRHSAIQHSQINTVLLIKILEISSGLALEELIKKYSNAALVTDFHRAIPQGQFINYYGKLRSLNSSAEFGLPFEINLFGSNNLFYPSTEVVQLIQNNIESIPKISGVNGFYVECYQEGDYLVYLFLNRISEKENFEAELKKYIRQRLLQ